MTVSDEYSRRLAGALRVGAEKLEDHLQGIFQGVSRIDRISARAKTLESFVKKSEKKDKDGSQKYDDPLKQIQDQIGARIVVFYLSDIAIIQDILGKYFKHIERREMFPDSEWEFGYFGWHSILLIPSDIGALVPNRTLLPLVFEIQIKTLFQHAWSEANHDLGYKEGGRPIGSEEKRLFAYTSAQAWGADRQFEELAKRLRAD